jgi:hypothetical protein
MPKGKMVVLGLVTTKRPELESKDDLKRRIDEAAKFVPLDQICLSGQCGFSSTVEGNALTYDEQVAKLRLIVETARDVWGDLAAGQILVSRLSDPAHILVLSGTRRGVLSAAAGRRELPRCESRRAGQWGVARTRQPGPNPAPRPTSSRRN